MLPNSVLIMKKILVVLCTLCLLAACHNNGRKQQTFNTFESAQAAFQATITPEDSSAVITATEEVMSLLKAGEIDAALSHIYVVADNVLYRPDNESLLRLKSKFTMFPVLSYEMTDIAFQTSAINDVTYQYVFAESSDDSTPATFKLGFNPVKIEGQWYLTFKDGNMTSKTMQQDYQMNPMAPAPDDVRLPDRPESLK